MRKWFCLLAGAVILPGAAAAQENIAQDGYTIEELVDFYVNSVELGGQRGICIGTEQECAEPEESEPQGLDMLVTFELDSSDLTPDAQQNLEIFAQMMQDRRLQVANFVVEGHTDARGGENYNKRLSEARAVSVVNFLTQLGVGADRLTAVGLGTTKPRTGDGFDAENRRVEMRIDLN
ncbi:MAG: OmpA family protein [Pseudomonadota bacterium]